METQNLQISKQEQSADGQAGFDGIWPEMLHTARPGAIVNVSRPARQQPALTGSRARLFRQRIPLGDAKEHTESSGDDRKQNGRNLLGNPARARAGSPRR
jgi:hypothetical protein